MEGNLMPLDKAMLVARVSGKAIPFSTGLEGDYDEEREALLVLANTIKAFVDEGPYVSEGMGSTVCSHCGAEESGTRGLGLSDSHSETCLWVMARRASI